MTPARFVNAALVLALVGGCRQVPNPAIIDLLEARRLAADLRVQFTKAADASNRAVMADTDEASVAYAREAERFKGAIRVDTEVLGPRLRDLGQDGATQALQAFQRQFAEYDKVDGEILALAVENTNLKAQRLSFGPGREAADAFRDSLQTAVASAATRDRCRAEGLAGTAVMAVREVQVVWAPHIAETQDDVMTRFEKEIAQRQAQARDAVAALSGLVDAKGKRALESARAALGRFDAISQELVKLSRRNTNVRSLDLALRRKPALTGACDESLRALEKMVAKNPFPATR